MKKFPLSILLAVLSMLGPFAVDTHFPAFSGIANDFGVEKTQIQYTLSAYLISSAIMTLVLGPLSDAFGRRKIILAFLGVFFIASFAAIFAQNLEILLICRTLQGMAGGIGMVLGQAIVRDKMQGAEAQKTMSAISMIFGIAPAFAPILGGYLFVHFGWRSIFLFLCLFAAYNFIVVFFFLEESLKPELRHKFSIKRIFGNYAIILKKPEFTLRAMAHGFGFAGIGVYICVAPTYIIDILKLKETSFGWLFV
ncbi:MAG: Bcr/CflA family efflux MFS transporter, partial [Caulobacterales bacterium]|nr:Bcr/CflA family efflux MFS transporter [Caulobacterales bacterium]